MLKAVRLRLEASRQEWIVVATLLGFAIAGVGVSGLPSGVKTLGVLGLALYGWSRWWRWRRPRLVQVDFVDRVWQLSLDGKRLPADLVPQRCFYSPLFIVLCWRLPDGGVWQQALFADSADQDELRRLRIWLKHGGLLARSDAS